MDVQLYLADIAGINANSLLDDWGWLLSGHPYTVFRVTAMGDLILKNPAGQFYLLDMVDGKLLPLADSEPMLWTVLTDRNFRKSILLVIVVQGLRESGVTIGPKECYSPDHPPVLGGKMTNDNLRPCDIRVHASIMGQIHRQVRDLPPGTRISEVRFET